MGQQNGHRIEPQGCFRSNPSTLYKRKGVYSVVFIKGTRAFISWTNQKPNAEEIDVMLKKKYTIEDKNWVEITEVTNQQYEIKKFTISIYKFVMDTVIQHFTDQFESIHTELQKPQIWICKTSVSDILIPLILF